MRPAADIAARSAGAVAIEHLPSTGTRGSCYRARVKRRTRILAVAGLILAAAVSAAVSCAAGAPEKPPAQAKSAPASKEVTAPKVAKDPCANAADEAALLGCRQQENRTSEAALRELADRLTKSYTQDEPARAKVLSTAQGKWRDYRDAECKLRTYDSSSGSAHEVYWLSCLTTLNQERLAALRKLADNP